MELNFLLMLKPKRLSNMKLCKVPKISEMQTIWLTENGLKLATSKAWLFIDARALKFLISPIGTQINFIHTSL